MNSKRVYYLLLACVIALAIMSFGAVYMGNKMLTQASIKLVGYKLENKVLDEQQTALSLVSKQSSKYTELENISKSVVPQDKDQAKAVREIVSLGDESGISLQSVTFPTSSLGAAPAAGAGTASGATAKPTSGVTQVKPVVGIPGVYQLDITVQSSAAKANTYEQLTNFLSKLEHNRRTAQVTSLTITPAPGSNKLSFTLIVSVYLKP